MGEWWENRKINHYRGDKVAWKMIGGETMTGTITDIGMDVYYITRPDGGTVIVKKDDVWTASEQEVKDSISWFRPK